MLDSNYNITSVGKCRFRN